MICENCSDVNCRFRNLIGDYCNDYKPKEKQMENKLQITEEYAREIYRAGVFINPCGSMENEYVRMLKDAGYIRKSPVEEAEELFQNKHQHDQAWVMSKMNDAIQYLKAENERLKK